MYNSSECWGQLPSAHTTCVFILLFVCLRGQASRHSRSDPLGSSARMCGFTARQRLKRGSRTRPRSYAGGGVEARWWVHTYNVCANRHRFVSNIVWAPRPEDTWL
eukprot:15962454-Heterocapsa_arctica.AAC.1